MVKDSRARTNYIVGEKRDDDELKFSLEPKGEITRRQKQRQTEDVVGVEED